MSALTYVGAAAALWACASESVNFRNLTIMQVANTFAATTTPAGVGGLALSTRFLQKSGLGAMRATPRWPCSRRSRSSLTSRC